VKKFIVEIDGKAKTIHAKSMRDLKSMLRRQLNKRHLVGVKITPPETKCLDLKSKSSVPINTEWFTCLNCKRILPTGWCADKELSLCEECVGPRI